MDRRHRPAGANSDDADVERRESERRARGERRRTGGLLELRARREGSDGDRRQKTRGRWFALWQRVRSQG